MIIRLKPNVAAEQVATLAHEAKAIVLQDNGQTVLVTSSSVKELPSVLAPIADSHIVTATDMQLSSREYLATTREVSIGDVTIGGNTGNTVMITGPCSVESKEQIEDCGQFIAGLGLKTIRGGCFKPRTSPYSFQGLGLEGLKLLADVRAKYGLKVVTEVRDATQVEQVIEYTDVVQIGAKAMYDQGILRACGKIQKPVLLKRGFGTKLQEFVQAAEFVLSGGNPNVILCERGIRTFETKTRFTLDLCAVAFLKEKVNLPVILDPSHAMGIAYGVPDLTRACMAMGIDGLLIETHPNPKVAKSDAAQQLNFEQFEQLFNSLKPIGQAVGRTLV